MKFHFVPFLSISFLTRPCYITQYFPSVFFVLFIPLAENEWKFARYGDKNQYVKLHTHENRKEARKG
jgi:hypothetical protein